MQKHTGQPKHFLSCKEARCRGQSLISNDGFLEMKHTGHPKHFLSCKEARYRGQSLINNDGFLEVGSLR